MNTGLDGLVFFLYPEKFGFFYFAKGELIYGK